MCGGIFKAGWEGRVIEKWRECVSVRFRCAIDDNWSVEMWKY